MSKRIQHQMGPFPFPFAKLTQGCYKKANAQWIKVLQRFLGLALFSFGCRFGALGVGLGFLDFVFGVILATGPRGWEAGAFLPWGCGF